MYEMPAALYKYLNADRTTTVLRIFRFASVRRQFLNDATELKPVFKGIATQSDLKRLLTDRLREKYPGLVERVEQSLPSHVAAQLIDDVLRKGRRSGEEALPTKREENSRFTGQELRSLVVIRNTQRTPSVGLLRRTADTAF